jgi:hypothetical protein
MWARWGVPVPVVTVIAGVVLLTTGCTSGGSATSHAVTVATGVTGLAAAAPTSAATGPVNASTGSTWSASTPGAGGTPPSAASGHWLPLWPFTGSAQV